MEPKTTKDKDDVILLQVFCFVLTGTNVVNVRSCNDVLHYFVLLYAARPLFTTST
jgi:hypothetical protein